MFIVISVCKFYIIKFVIILAFLYIPTPTHKLLTFLFFWWGQILKGEVDEEKLDSYDAHFYAPSKNEIEDEVRKEGSFGLDQVEMFEIEREDKDGVSYGTAVAMAVRAIQESMICQHFGERVLDNLFYNYGRMLDEEMTKEEIKPVSFALVLRKLK